MKVGSKQNEWVVIYLNGTGERCLEFFDTYKEAEKFFEGCLYKIGILTTLFYNHYIEEIPDIIYI